MQKLNRKGPQTMELGSVRTAMATRLAVTQLNDYPYFVHKWTKQKRHYAVNDLGLPRSVFVCGKWPRWQSPVIGVGGTRSPTVETFCLVASVVRVLARSGAIIISGGVPGVDLAAHIAASDQPKGVTLAVLANPAEMGLRGHEWHSETVAAQIAKRGAFLSEYARACEVGGPEFCERLLARDRIISGLSDIMLVFECSEDSATTDTARRALAQGKQVSCISSVRKSPRCGVEQLSDEFGVPVFDERVSTPREIAEGVLESMRLAVPAAPAGSP